MGEVTISVAGRAYQIVCEDGEENRLTAIAARVDREAQAFGGATPSLSEPRLLLMCALLLADKLDEVESAPQATSPPPSAMNAEPSEVDTSAMDEATVRIEALTQSSGAVVVSDDTPSASNDEAEPADEAEAEAEASPEPAGQTARPSKSSAAVAAEKDLLSWADRSESREEPRASDKEADAEAANDDEADPEIEAAESNAPDPAPASEDAAEDDEPAESETERTARERSDRRKRRRERLARLAKETSDDP